MHLIMGLFSAEHFKSRYADHFCNPTDKCWYCCEPLNGDDWIFWDGGYSQIWMHPECAKRLADNLNKDWDRFKHDHPEKL